MDADAFVAARDFVEREARLLERRLFAALFDGGNSGSVIDALLGYRNADGGFGWGLEPDKRVAASQALDAQLALEAMDAVGVVDRPIVGAVCDWLLTQGAGVPCITPAALEAARAPHWDVIETPSLNPTAALAGLLWKWGFGHAWRAAATDWCWEQLADGIPATGHTVSCALTFLEHVPDRTVADVLVEELRPRLPTLPYFNHEPGSAYGLTPLHLAPTPSSRWATLFSPDLLALHLDSLEAAQQADGGWPISWTTIGPAAEQEWRGYETVRAVRVLRAFGRAG